MGSFARKRPAPVRRGAAISDEFPNSETTPTLTTSAHSKCIKSAIFGDPDNLWEVLWYPNSGVQGGEYASLYLSCVVSNSQHRVSPTTTTTHGRCYWC